MKTYEQMIEQAAINVSIFANGRFGRNQFVKAQAALIDAMFDCHDDTVKNIIEYGASKGWNRL